MASQATVVSLPACSVLARHPDVKEKMQDRLASHEQSVDDLHVFTFFQHWSQDPASATQAFLCLTPSTEGGSASDYTF